MITSGRLRPWAAPTSSDPAGKATRSEDDQSRARSNNPKLLVSGLSVRFKHGLSAPISDDVTRPSHPIFTLQGDRRSGLFKENSYAPVGSSRQRVRTSFP
jgi:hypothetical protein